MRTPFLKTLRAKLEAALVAAAFAEEREVEAARELLSQAWAPGGRDRSARR